MLSGRAVITCVRARPEDAKNGVAHMKPAQSRRLSVMPESANPKVPKREMSKKEVPEQTPLKIQGMQKLNNVKATPDAKHESKEQKLEFREVSHIWHV